MSVAQRHITATDTSGKGIHMQWQETLFQDWQLIGQADGPELCRDVLHKGRNLQALIIWRGESRWKAYAVRTLTRIT